jgi:hypothetical protein
MFFAFLFSSCIIFQLYERRKTGRPKLRWLDCIESDLKSMDVKRWSKKVEDRSVWAFILKEADKCTPVPLRALPLSRKDFWD